MKTKKQHSIQYNVLMNFILNGSQVIFSLITFPYVTRVLLTEGYGRVNFVYSIANYFLTVAALGIPTYGVRLISQLRDDKEGLSKATQELLIIHGVMTAFIMGIYLLLTFLVPSFRKEMPLFLIYSAYLMLNVFGMGWFYRALEQYDYITLRSVVFNGLSVVLILIFVKSSGDYLLYAGFTVLAVVGSYGMNFFRARRFMSFRKQGKYQFRQHMKPILILFAQSVAASVYLNLDTVMLGLMKGNADVGYYTAAVRIKGLLGSVVISISTVLLPRMSYFLKQRRTREFQEVMVSSLNVLGAFSIPMVLFFFVFARPTILFLAGKGYETSILAMQIMIPCVFFTGATDILGVQVLTALNREKQVMYSCIAGAVGDFLGNLLLIPQFGVAGAGISTLVAGGLVFLLQAFYAKDVLWSQVSSMRYLIYIGCALIAMLPALAIRDLADKLVISLLGGLAVFILIYGFLLLLCKDPVMKLINPKNWKGGTNEG